MGEKMHVEKIMDFAMELKKCDPKRKLADCVKEVKEVEKTLQEIKSTETQEIKSTQEDPFNYLKELRKKRYETKPGIRRLNLRDDRILEKNFISTLRIKQQTTPKTGTQLSKKAAKRKK